MGGAGARKQSPPLKTSNVLMSKVVIVCGGCHVVVVANWEWWWWVMAKLPPLKMSVCVRSCWRVWLLKVVALWQLLQSSSSLAAVVAILVLVGGAAGCYPCIIGSCCCRCCLYSAVFTLKPVAATAVSKIKTRKITDAPLHPLSSCSPSVLRRLMWERWGVEGCVVVVSETSCWWGGNIPDRNKN